MSNADKTANQIFFVLFWGVVLLIVGWYFFSYKPQAARDAEDYRRAMERQQALPKPWTY